MRAEINEDNDKKSRGYGTVQFETPMDALNAVSILKTLRQKTLQIFCTLLRTTVTGEIGPTMLRFWNPTSKVVQIREE